MLAPDLVEARAVAITDPSAAMLKEGGAGLTAFNAQRARMRTRVAELEPVLYPPDEDAC